jgi:hypothetical protein
MGMTGAIGATGATGKTGATGATGAAGTPAAIIPFIRGTVGPDCTILTGSGYTCTVLGVGRYQLTWTVPFTARPTVVASKIFGSEDINAGADVQPAENAIVDLTTVTMAIVATGDAAGVLSPSSFGFVATAPH